MRTKLIVIALTALASVTLIGTANAAPPSVATYQPAGSIALGRECHPKYYGLGTSVCSVAWATFAKGATMKSRIAYSFGRPLSSAEQREQAGFTRKVLRQVPKMLPGDWSMSPLRLQWATSQVLLVDYQSRLLHK
jgi:hypothetical protein